MLYVLPQLPCKNRYTEDWANAWSRELDKLKVQFRVLDNNMVAVPITKFFTDPSKALIYECEQIEKLACHDFQDDTIFCLDIDFPGLLTAAIPVLKLINPDLKCYGYLHAGSWCNGDIFSDELSYPSKRWLELASFVAFDIIFVATNYHKEKIREYYWYDGWMIGNTRVVGFPFYKEDVYRYEKPLSYLKKKLIVINGRNEQSDFGKVSILEKTFPKERFCFIEAEDRKDYYHLLNQAKIVISLKTEETFGIGPLEAYVLGSIPLCPNDYAYPETIGDPRLLYNDEKDLVEKLAYLLTLKENPFKIEIEKYRNTIAKCMSFVS